MPHVAIAPWQLGLLLASWILSGLVLGYWIGETLTRSSFQKAYASFTQACEDTWPDPAKADQCLGRYARFLGD